MKLWLRFYFQIAILKHFYNNEVKRDEETKV